MSLFSNNELPDNIENILPEEEQILLEKVARKVVERGWTVVAILFLESVKPLNYISAQTMVFFEPIVQTIFNFSDYNTFRVALEKRETIELLLLKIEEYDAVELDKERRIKKFIKKEKKNWKWYQRYLGVFTPKLDIPDEVDEPPQEPPPPPPA